jgi:hypothetical protein
VNSFVASFYSHALIPDRPFPFMCVYVCVVALLVLLAARSSYALPVPRSPSPPSLSQKKLRTTTAHCRPPPPSSSFLLLL